MRVFSPEPGIVISIHAPAKGATVTTPENCMLLQAISIHAPTKGGTPKSILFSFVTVFQSTLPRRERHEVSDHIVFCPDFNPRSREGSDFASRSHKHPRQISIHAPAKGATMMSWCWGKAIRFQSTLPRRERLVTVICCLTSGYFNPRSREGSDKGSK